MTPSDGDDERPPETDATQEAARREAEAWQQIVDNYGDHPSFDDPPPAGTAERPTGEQPTDQRDARPGSTPTHEPVRPAPSRGDLVGGPSRGRADDDEVEEPDDPDDHYLPPPPPRVPLASPPRLLAWLGLFGVPLLTLVAVVTGVSLPQWLSVLFMAWFVGGFVFLVASMRPGPRDDHDDGAVV